MRELIVVGVGPGVPELVTPAAMSDVLGADCVVAAPRHMALLEKWKRHEKVVTFEGIETTFARMEAETGSVAVLVSGDPGLYSLLPALKKRFPDVPLRVQPGISSLQALCAAAGEAWQGAVILSGHGRPLSVSKFLSTVERNRLTILFCDNICSPSWACRVLTEAIGGLEERVKVVIGERLGYENACVSKGQPKEFSRQNFSPLSLILVQNTEPWLPPFQRPGDQDFIRAQKIPMTREEVRSIALDRLNMTREAVLWDIGAGTGSVSVTAALEYPDSEVYSVERNADALNLLEQNKIKFRLHNVNILSGYALSVINTEKLPDPTHVFIGGSGGELQDILSYLEEKTVRVVVSAVTLNTLSEAATALKNWEDFEAIQILTSTSRTLLGGNLLMEGRNPVTLLCANSRKLKLSKEGNVL